MEPPNNRVFVNFWIWPIRLRRLYWRVLAASAAADEDVIGGTLVPVGSDVFKVLRMCSYFDWRREILFIVSM